MPETSTALDPRVDPLIKRVDELSKKVDELAKKIEDNRREISFEKVSLKEFKKSILSNKQLNVSEDSVAKIYSSIKLPVRSTKLSAGYDFFFPVKFSVNEASTILIPTGIKCKMDDKLVLMLYPRSSYGIKYGMQIVNTVGIIDADYYNNKDNEGHIMIKLFFNPFSHSMGTIESRNTWRFNAGDKFVQGVFTKYYISTEEADVTTERTGGIGSTSK